MKKRNMGLIAVLILSGVVFAGCTDKEDVADTSSNDVDNVTVIESDENEPVDEIADEIEDTDNDAEDQDAVDDVDTPEDETEVDINDSEEEDEDVTVDAVIDEDGRQTIGTSTSADGASVIGYSYEIQSGNFVFKWKVRATEEEPYPKAIAYFDSANVLTVEYESLVKDYVAKEEISNDLGSLLPTLNWVSADGGSTYEFEFDEAKTFTLKTEDMGEDGQFILLEVAL